MQIENILCNNIYNKRFSSKFLLIGACLPNIYPKVVGGLKREWKNLFSICLEQAHYNLLHAKLSSILALGKTKKVGFLTVDGSPHCVQVHFVSKYLKRELKVEVEFEHYVINKEGKVFKVSMEEIDKSRNFALVGEEVAGYRDQLKSRIVDKN